MFGIFRRKKRSLASKIWKFISRIRLLSTIIALLSATIFLLPMMITLFAVAPFLLILYGIDGLESKAKTPSEYRPPTSINRDYSDYYKTIDRNYNQNILVEEIGRNLGLPIKDRVSVITSPMGYRSIKISTGFHGGIDLSGTKDKTELYAAAEGTVIHAGWINGYGYTVVIKHPIFYGNTRTVFYTYYAHISNMRNIFVEVGDTVGKGQHIANLGHSGNSTGPHLHFEVRLPWGDDIEKYDDIALQNYTDTGKLSGLVDPLSVLNCRSPKKGGTFIEACSGN